MAVTSKDLRSSRPVRRADPRAYQRVHIALYGVSLLLAAMLVYGVVGLAFDRAHVLYDDLRYGRPRTDQITAFVGHHEAAGVPTHLVAMNLNRQVVIVEMPGSDPAQTRTILGPYLFGANEDLTPVKLSLADVDGDNVLDLLVDVRQEHIVYLNHDGVFRLPTPAEHARLLASYP
jgi:hypothetical protein